MWSRRGKDEHTEIHWKANVWECLKYELSFTDREFGNFFSDFGIDIHTEKYTKIGTSKAKKLRSFWEQESDALVADVLEGLVDLSEETSQSFTDDFNPSERDIVGAREAIARFKSGSSNALSKFQQELASLQVQLEELPDKHLNLPIKFIRGSDSKLRRNPRTVTLSNFSITNVTYTNGSVVAKIQIGCVAAMGVTTFLATYPDAKDGYHELRDDLQYLSTSIFDSIEEGAPVPQEPDSQNVSYYFLKPDTIEENLKKLR